MCDRFADFIYHGADYLPRGDEIPSFKCTDIGMPCKFEATAKTEAELLKKIAKHAKTAHKIDPMPPDLLAVVKKVIKR